MRCWPDSHNLRKPHFKSIIEGRAYTSLTPNLPTKKVTVFGNPSIQNSISTFNFAKGHPESTLEIFKIDFLNPDAPGSGTTYNLNFLINGGKQPMRPPISQWCSPNSPTSTTSIFLPPKSCVFGSSGGTINVNIALSRMSSGLFDDCWNVVFHYRAYKD